jgi:hypothetical protein
MFLDTKQKVSIIRIYMFFRISQIIKPFTLGIFFISISINGMANNHSAINQLLKTARENSGKLFLVSGLFVAACFGYKYRSPIKQYLYSCKQSFNRWTLRNLTIDSNPDLYDIRPDKESKA